MNQEQTIWMHPNQVYIVSGGASANSLLFENKRCHLPAGRKSSILQAGEIFFKYFNRFVYPMVNILHYKLNSTEWALLIQIKGKKEICKAYLSQRDKSDKADRNKDLTEVKRMLSEHFRMFLSQFARECNMHLERKGVVVMRKFDKMLVSSELDYHEEFERLCDLKFCNYQQLKEKYRPDKGIYDEENFLVDLAGRPHFLRSSIGLYDKRLKLTEMPVSVVLVKPYSNVLRKILYKASINKKPKFPPPKRE